MSEQPTVSLRLDRQHTALLIMDFQQASVPTALEKRPDILDKTAAVIAAARTAGLPVIYIVVQFRDGYPEVSPRNKIFSSLRQSGRLLASGPHAPIHPQVAPQPNDVVLTKVRVGAFSTTPLETILRAQEATSLILCGIMTSGVVLSTVRAAADADYDLVVVEDCCADIDDEVHRVLTQKVFPRQARVVTANSVIADLR
jgi:nicotinamidase-related amidase